MNYLRIILSFWQLRRSKRITSLQADLYYFLLQESSSRGEGLEWENPFECANKIICTGIGISEDSIVDARNRLKQLGLIDFQPGRKNERSPVYELFYPFKSGNLPGNLPGKHPGKPPGKHPGKVPYTINRTNVTEQYQNDNSFDADASSAEGGAASETAGSDLETDSDQRKKSSAQKKKGDAEPTEHWPALVSEWHRFYAQQFDGAIPHFKGEPASNFKQLIAKLRRRVEAAKSTAGHPWTEGFAVDWLHKFLSKAWTDPWLRDNFQLNILNQKFDSIVDRNGQSTAKSGQPAGPLNADHKRDLAERLAKAAGQSGHAAR